MTESQNGSSANLSKYVVFKRLADEFGEKDVWQQLGEVEAHGAYNAREKAIQEFNLMDEARNGELEMIALGARFWTPKRPKVNVSESIDVS